MIFIDKGVKPEWNPAPALTMNYCMLNLFNNDFSSLAETVCAYSAEINTACEVDVNSVVTCCEVLVEALNCLASEV